VNIYPYTSVICRFISEFNEAGINQVRHKIYLDVVTHVDLVMPTAKSNFNVHIQVLIAENILTGDVPYTYLFVDSNGSNLLDLIP
jgi:Sporulation protein YunB (Spo_YunB).